MNIYKVSYVRLSACFIAFGVVCFILATLLGWFTPLVLTAWVFSYASLGFFLYGIHHPGGGVTVVYKDAADE